MKGINKQGSKQKRPELIIGGSSQGFRGIALCLKSQTAVALSLLIWLIHPLAATAQPDTDGMVQKAKDLYDSGNFEAAQTILYRAIAKQENNSVEYAATLQNLALIEYMNFNFPEAEKLYLKALPITESLCGTDSMATANNLYGLSRCLRRSSRYAEADPYLSRILAIRTKVLGSDHRLVTNSLFDLAVNSSRQSKNESAILYSSMAVQARESALGKDSPFLIPSLRLYADMLRAANESKAGAIEARIQALSLLSISVPNKRDPSRREEDGSSWQSPGAKQQASDSIKQLVSRQGQELDKIPAEH